LERESGLFWGKITMISAVLSSIPMYFLSFFPLSRWLKREIDSLRRKFLWGRTQQERKAYCLVSWKVYKRKEFGDLGVINLRDINTTLFLKW